MRVKKKPSPGVGVDIGGVIIEHSRSLDMGSLLRDDFLTAVPVLGALQGLSSLVRRFGAERTFIISKARQTVAERTLCWFQAHDVFRITGLLAKNIIFVREPRDKFPLCTQLGITLFIDDTFAIVRSIFEESNCMVIWFRGGAKCRRQLVPPSHLDQVIVRETWEQILAIVWSS